MTSPSVVSWTGSLYMEDTPEYLGLLKSACRDRPTPVLRVRAHVPRPLNALTTSLHVDSILKVVLVG